MTKTQGVWPHSISLIMRNNEQIQFHPLYPVKAFHSFAWRHDGEFWFLQGGEETAVARSL